MYQKVDSWIDVVALEHRILDFWKSNNAFEILRKKNEGNKPWSFLDGPITANNPMGVHHAWGRTLKDFYQRYHAMQGYDLRYQNGFDCQGLWVEVEVEKELGFKNKNDIESYGIAQFVEKCRERVYKYSKIQTDQSIRLGYWMDWENSYFTMSEENNYTIWQFLRKCHDRGLIYKGFDVMPWCTRCATGLSQHEMHEGYHDTEHTTVVVSFPIRGREREALLVWTTTLWTLTSNIAAAVNPDLEYAKVYHAGWTYYLAAMCVERVFSGKGEYEIKGYLKGAELVGWSYDGPFDEIPVQRDTRLAHPVISWDEVSAFEGTGIVHIAPGCGKEDNELGNSLGLDAIAPINDVGLFFDGFDWLTGRDAMTIAPDILANLREKGIVFRSDPYTHSYPHCWRCGRELLFRHVDEWFISMDPWRDEIKEVTRQIRWIPSYGQDLELDWLTNMRDWMISKKRYWGLALPIWVCESCNHFHVIASREELKEKAIAGWEKFDGHTPHRPWIDEVKIACAKCKSTAHRVKDVGNPWLDAGIVPYSTVKYSSDREYWKKWIPADLVLECFPGQFRNWFYSLLAMSTMMEGIPPFKTLLGHALVRDEKGREMHKSTGNAIWFDEAAEKMGADIMRWIYSSQETTINLNFGYNVAKEVRGKFYNTLWNTYGFFINYARIINYIPPTKPTPITERTDFDRWILSNLQLLIKKYRSNADEYNLRTSCRAIEEFVEDLSNWYIRHCRRRFWRGNNDADSRLAYETLYECLETLIRLIAPIMPFVSEEMYQNLVRSHNASAPLSVHHTAFPEVMEEWIDESLSSDMEVVIKLTSLALSGREKARMKVRQPLAELTICPADERVKGAAQRFADMLRDDLNVKKVTVLEPGSESPATYRVNPNFKVVGKKLGRLTRALKEYLEKEGLSVKAAFDAGEPLFTVQLDGTPVSLAPEDVLITSESPEGISFVEDRGTWLAFDTRLTEELRLEGQMRDLLRRLQMQRKEYGLEIEDTIKLTYHTDSSNFQRIMETYGEFLSSELLTTNISSAQSLNNGKVITIGEDRISITMEKTGTIQ